MKPDSMKRRGGDFPLAILVMLVAMVGYARPARAVKFEIVVLPDTEDYIDAEEGFPGIMEAQTQWIVDHREAENIVFVSHLGDLIHHDPVAEMPEALSAMGKLDGQVPYSVSAGNHELESATSRQLFAENFGPTRYAPYDWYGGSYDTFNHYQIFSAEDYDFLHINLRKSPDRATLSWAQEVIDANRGKPTILSTHDYLTSDTTRSSAGDSIWNGLVKDNPQIFMTLSGHIHDPKGVAHMLSDNSAGKRVLQILTDFQDYTTAPSGNTDTGYLSKAIFDTDAKTISVQTYSPTYEAVPWLTDADHQYSLRAEFLPQVDGVAWSPINVVPATVVRRHVFYDNCLFDLPAVGNTDDDAIAPDKQALLPGETAGFDNYTSYFRGINGIMVDIDYLPGTPTAEDFQFKVGNDNDPDSWHKAPDPREITVRPGEGDDGSDRVTIRWEDNAIEKEWLQVIVKATEETGLEAPDVFYFGNAIGESGTSPGDAKVNAIDMLGVRNNPHDQYEPALIDDFFDFDRDAKVNLTDMLIARTNTTHHLNTLNLITVPGLKTVAVPEPSTCALLAAGSLGLLAWRRRKCGAV